MSLTLGVEVRLLRGIQAIVVRNDVSRQLGEVFLPGARKTYIPDDPSTLFDFELGDKHLLREEVGHRVRSRPSEEGTTNRQGEAALNLNCSSAIPDGYLRFHLVLPVGKALEPSHEAARLRCQRNGRQRYCCRSRRCSLGGVG